MPASPRGAEDVEGTKMVIYNTKYIETFNWAVAFTGSLPFSMVNEVSSSFSS